MTSYIRRRTTTTLVIHYAATYPSMDIGAKEIRSWHKAKGWIDIGYHYVIRRDGTVEIGRPAWAQGAHVAGHNSYTIAICLVGGAKEGNPNVGEDNFTNAQWAALATLTRDVCDDWGIEPENVLGHRDFPGVTKACPGFDVQTWIDDEAIFVATDETNVDEEVEQNDRYVYVSTALPTFWTIAMRFGCTVEQLIELNPETDYLDLEDGEQVILPDA